MEYRLLPTLSIMLTYQCNIECRHCGPYCGPREKAWMSFDEIKDLVQQASELDTFNVVLTGGEPTLLGRKLTTLLRFIRDETNIASTRMVTNGSWATTFDRAYIMLKEWQEAGLVELNVSCGDYHQEFISVERVVNAFKAARELNYPTVLLGCETIYKKQQKSYLQLFSEYIGEELLPPELMSPYISECHGLRCSIPMNYGRGKTNIDEKDLVFLDEDKIPNLCYDVLNAITVHPNGNTTACCGIMTRDESFMNIGNWKKHKLSELLKSARNDIILNWIRYLGLKDMKNWLKKKDPSIKFKEKYINMCDLCAEMIFDKSCQEILVKYGSERSDDILTSKITLDSTIYNHYKFNYK